MGRATPSKEKTLRKYRSHRSPSKDENINYKARGRLSRESSPERRVGSRDSSPERRVQSRHSSPERRVQSRDSSPERRVKSRESSPERRVQNREPSLRNRSQSPSSKSQLTYRSRYGRASHRRNTRIYKRSRSKSSSSSSSSSSSAASSSSTTPSTRNKTKSYYADKRREKERNGRKRQQFIRLCTPGQVELIEYKQYLREKRQRELERNLAEYQSHRRSHSPGTGINKHRFPTSHSNTESNGEKKIIVKLVPHYPMDFMPMHERRYMRGPPCGYHPEIPPPFHPSQMLHPVGPPFGGQMMPPMLRRPFHRGGRFFRR